MTDVNITPPWALANVSVVLVLPQERQVDTQTISPDNLERHHIVPSSPKASNVVALPMFALTEYPNSLSIRAEPNRVVFEQRTAGAFLNEYLAHDAAVKYADATKMTRYPSLGLNWVMVPPDGTKWIRHVAERLASTLGTRQFVPERLHLAQGVEEGREGRWNIFINGGARPSVEFNYHVDSAGRTPTDILTEWPSCQQHIRDEFLPLVKGW